MGGAPANSGTYYFVVKVVEQTNYNSITSQIYTLIIQNENYNLYPEEEDRTYSWLSDNNYVSIAKTNQNGIIELKLVSNIFDSNVIYKLGENYAFSSDDKVYTISFSPDMNILTITNSTDFEDTYSFTKFQEPEFVGTYVNGDGTGKIEIFSSYGNLKFKFTYLNKDVQVVRSGYNILYSVSGDIYNLTFIYDENETIPSSHATYNAETQVITVTNIVPPNYVGEYTKV